MDCTPLARFFKLGLKGAFVDLIVTLLFRYMGIYSLLSSNRTASSVF